MTTAAHGAEVVQEVDTAVHRAAPECKVAATIAFVIAVALVPRGAWWCYAVDGALLAVAALVAGAPAGLLLGRLAIEIPFVIFIALLPFVGGGPDVHVLGVTVSQPGLETAGGVLAKASLAVLATGVLAWTTRPGEIVAGLDRLRAPRQMTAIATFAVRYLQVVVDELRQMQAARVARGDDPRWLWQMRAIGQCAGALVMRAFERGERVHRSMLARGYVGRFPIPALAPAGSAREWAALLAAPAVAATATLHAGGVA